MVKRRFSFFIILIFLILIIIPKNANAASDDLYLNNLNFDVKINSNGSMNVIETWNIRIYDTNTLFKTFIIDSSKYSSIDNVKVTEITNNKNKSFEQIDKYMYHVTKDCFQALRNPEGRFEIAWGVGLENKSSTRQYKIEYTVNDAITKYNDYAELYWQFVGNNFNISAKSVTGTIILPANADGKEQIKVWGHTKDLNGTIYATDINKIEFDLNNYRGNRYIEIRSLFPTSMITQTKRVYSTNILETAVAEETKWAEDANRQRNLEKLTTYLIIGAIYFVLIILFIVFVRKIKKYWTVLKDLNKFEPTQKLEYYRDLPDEKATPGEAAFLLKDLYITFRYDIGKIFAATMLDLTLKGFIELEVNKELKEKDSITIRILDKNDEDLKKDEKEVLTFLKKASENDEFLTMKKIEKYIKESPVKVDRLENNIHQAVKNNLDTIKYFSKEEYKRYCSYSTIFVLYIIGMIFTAICPPTAIVAAINAILCYKIMKRINILTVAGLDQKEMWKGLKKYMEEFSLLKEREIPELVIWEKYLVYATAFGIADKVLKQLKIVYPNIDKMDNFNTSTYMYFMYHSNFNTNFVSAINTSVSSAYSSGSGSGGGFSGGGGFGGRRPEVVDGR